MCYKSVVDSYLHLARTLEKCVVVASFFNCVHKKIPDDRIGKRNEINCGRYEASLIVP